MTADFFSEADQDYREWNSNGPPGEKSYITIAKANRLLRERGLRVSGQVESEYKSHLFGNGQFGLDPNDTHTALLICVEPIEKDSAEKIVDDLLKWENDKEIGYRMDLQFRELFGRARALRGGK